MNKDIRNENYWFDYYEEKKFNFGYAEACDDVSVEIGKELKKNEISGWNIVNGYVLLPGEDYPRNHTWIEFEDGNIIDICCIYFFGVDSNEVKRVENYYSVFRKDGSEECFVTNTYSLEEYSKHLKWLNSEKPLELF